MLPTLYKRTAKGQIQFWTIEVDAPRARYRTVTGKQGTASPVVSEWTTAVPKNIGRANATTPAAQAEAEARAAWEKKLRDGYSEQADDAQADTRFQCMLAQAYSDPLRRREVERVLVGKPHFPRVFSQPKLDGVRCIATRHGLMSRKRRAIVAAPHVEAALAPLFAAHPDAVIDGELYNHDLRDNFNRIVELARKTRPSAADLEESAALLQYHVYDGVNVQPGVGAESRFEQRSVALVQAWTEVLEHADDFGALAACPLVETLACVDLRDIDECYARYLEAGYEGQMIRFDGPYEQKRSALLLKRKEHDDAEFEVVAIHEGEGNRSGQAGFVDVREAESGLLFSASIKGDAAFRVELLENRARYVGGQVTVRFNGRTPDGVPRFPRALHDKWFPEGRDL